MPLVKLTFLRTTNMRRIIAVTVAFAMLFTALPLFAAARAGRVAQPPGGTVSGTAQNQTGQAIARTTVQIRDLATGQLVSTTQSAADGAFSFAGLPAGNYAIEVVDAAGNIIGTSASITVAAGATVSSVIVSASAAGLLGTAGGAAAAGAAAAGGFSTAVVITSIAVAAGVGGAVAIANNNASPSR
jgi:hypothetical protein